MGRYAALGVLGLALPLALLLIMGVAVVGPDGRHAGSGATGRTRTVACIEFAIIIFWFAGWVNVVARRVSRAVLVCLAALLLAFACTHALVDSIGPQEPQDSVS